jgi:7-carboxy-7-deazaguanine synthase
MNDYEWSKKSLIEHDLAARVQILFSPSYQNLDPAVLAEWILQDQLPVRLQIQLHKILWGNQAGR